MKFNISDSTEAETVEDSTGQLAEKEKYWVSIGWTRSDSRPSAIATGAGAGTLFYVLPLLLLFVLDLPVFYRELRWGMLYNITGNEKYRTKKKIKKPKSGKRQDPRKSTNGMWVYGNHVRWRQQRGSSGRYQRVFVEIRSHTNCVHHLEN